MTNEPDCVLQAIQRMTELMAQGRMLAPVDIVAMADVTLQLETWEARHAYAQLLKCVAYMNGEPEILFTIE